MIIDIETNGLNPMENVISCIGILKDGESQITTFCGNDEKQILIDFWNEFDENNPIIGYNIITFDIPFIIKRSLVKHVEIKKIKKIIDLRRIVNVFDVSQDKYVRGTLGEWSVILGCGQKSTSGEQMIQFYNDKNFEEIANHCEEDVLITRKLYERCVECKLL